MLSIIDSLTLMTALFNAGLAVFILRGNTRNDMNLLLGLYLATLSIWAFALIGTQNGASADLWLYCAKATYAAGLIIASSFYLFSITFPEGTKVSLVTVAAIYGVSLLYIAVLFASPTFLTERIVSHDWGNSAVLNTNHYLIFTAIFCTLYLGGLARIWYKYAFASGETRLRLLVIALGVTITGAAGLYFDIILASPYIDEFRYIWTGPLFNTLMAVLIVYAVFRLRLFNAKVIVTELLISLLWIFTLLRTLVAAEQREQMLNGLLFLLAVAIGTVLIRSVRREVEQRELIEAQEKDLEKANSQQENLLHFISHEVKGYLAKNEAAFAAIAAGDFGPITNTLQRVSSTALADTRKGVSTVMDILDAANLKRGSVSFKKVRFDLTKAVDEIVSDLSGDAAQKGIELIYHKPARAFEIEGDEEKMRRHVIRNIIDNSIKYTLHGSVRVELATFGGKTRLTVSDTGVGITPEDMQRLFTEGGHGKDSIKVNVHSTGYGLYIAKQIVEAHGGRIWAESEGAGKGSRFIIEFPVSA